MDENPKKEHKLPSMSEMSEMFDKVQSQMNPLSYHFEKSNSLLGIASQYEHLNSAVSTGEIARKFFEQRNLTSANVISSSVSISLAQPQIREAVALQDSFRKIAEGLSVNNNTKLVSENIMEGIYINDLYKDTLESIGRLRESLKPWKDSFSIAGKAFNGSEFANLVRELQTSKVIPESTLSEYSDIFEQFESLKNLESFKAISRLKNFPDNKLWIQDYSEAPKLAEDFLVKAKSIDASISDEISSVDDFNDLSVNSQRSLEELNLSYYQIFIIHYIYYITILRDQISNSLKYSNMEFRFVGLSSKVLVGVCFIGFQPDFNSICNSILATILLESIKKDEKK